MMLHRKIFNVSSLLSRSITLSACRNLEVPSNKPIKQEVQDKMDADKKNMEWRIKPFERKDAWYSKFKLFLQDDNEKVKETFVTKLQQPLDITPSNLKNLWKYHSEKQERFLQQYVPERHETLGNDLAAAHFLVFRGGRIKFYGSQQWLRKDADGRYSLPGNYVDDMFLEAIDCEGMELYYEGLENLRRLKKLRFLSFKNLKTFDDWCMDRVSGSQFESLEMLNLTGTKVTFRGLQALHRIPSLKRLMVDDPYRDTEWKLTLAMLQDIIPELKIIDTNETAPEAEKV